MSDTELKQWVGDADYSTLRDGSIWACIEVLPGEFCISGKPHKSIEAAKADMEILIGYADDYAKRHGAEIDWTQNQKDGNK